MVGTRLFQRSADPSRCGGHQPRIAAHQADACIGVGAHPEGERQRHLDACESRAHHAQVDRPGSGVVVDEEPIEPVHQHREWLARRDRHVAAMAAVDGFGQRGRGMWRGTDVDRHDVVREHRAIPETDRPEHRIEPDGRRPDEAHARAACEPFDVDQAFPRPVVAGDHPWNHSRVGGERIGTDQGHLDRVLPVTRGGDDGQVAVAASEQHQVAARGDRRNVRLRKPIIDRHRCAVNRISPNQAVAFSPVLSVSVITAMPDTSGAS